MSVRIREQQMQSFSNMTQAMFVSRLKTELNTEMPEYCAPVDVDDYIAHGIERAAHHQVHSEIAVGRYVRLMLILGRDFDTDRQLPWAAETLGSNEFSNELKKMDDLTARAIAFVDHRSKQIKNQ